MNSYRYKHFRDSANGHIRSPFDKGRCQNLVDFIQVRVPGFRHPDRREWNDVYSADDVEKEELLSGADRMQHV